MARWARKWLAAASRLRLCTGTSPQTGPGRRHGGGGAPGLDRGAARCCPRRWPVGPHRPCQLLLQLTEDDDSLWGAAGDAWAALACPHEQAYARYRRAEALLAQRRAALAAVELRRAADLAAGFVPLTGQIVALARRGRIDLRTVRSVAGLGLPEPVVTAASKLGLTARELSVLEFLTAGKTNAQIGAALYMSPKTASVHVSSILRKLRVTNRVQAAAIAERMGLFDDDQEPGSRAGR